MLMPSLLPVGPRKLLALAIVLLTSWWTGSALAVTAGAVSIRPSADCSTNANLDVAWTGAGNHFESGTAYDAAGTVIGTFGPEASANSDWNGEYKIPIATAQPANALIGAYAWVGGNPPTSSGAIEYFVVYNCTSRVVLYQCSGAYGACANRVAAALAALPSGAGRAIPATSREALAALALLLAAIGAATLRRPGSVRPPR